MAWGVSGHMIEACSCNMFCPCWFAVPEVMVMDKGYCSGAIAFRVQEGNSDGVSLGGRTVVLGIDFPGPTLFDGNGTAKLYIDDAANTEQRREIETIFQGQKGGPMGVLAPLVSKWLPSQTANIHVREEGDTLTVDVGGAGNFQSRALKDQEGHGFELRGGGFVGGFGMEVAELAPTSSRWSDAGLPRLDTKSGARGNFSWSG